MNLFLKREADSPEVSHAHNPYLAARREWDERYGDLITRAKNWRMMAALCSLVALVATAGMVSLSVRSHVVPFVVLVDNLGRPVASGVADQTSLNDDRLKRSNIFNWVENLRTVTTDGVSQRKAIDRVYAQIASGSEAQTFVSEYYRGDPPFKRAQTETVSVEVKSVLPTSDRTYEVEWAETTRDLYGTVKATDRWKGYLSIVLNPPKDERQARIDPIGVYITNASWAKVLGKTVPKGGTYAVITNRHHIHLKFRMDAVRAVSASRAAADRDKTSLTGCTRANTTEKHTAALAAVRLRRSIADFGRLWQFGCRREAGVCDSWHDQW